MFEVNGGKTPYCFLSERRLKLMKIGNINVNKNMIILYISMVIPLTLQNLVTSSVNLLDNLMIGSLGESPLAGVAMANKVFFVYNLMMFGVCSGAIVFFSQFWGKKDEKGIKNVMSVGFTLAVSLALIFTLGAVLIPDKLMYLLTGGDTEIMSYGCGYLRISAIGYIFFGLSFVMGAGLKSIERPKTALMGSVVSLIVNGSLNYILIFGKLGFPALGVKGAAIATVTARICEFAVVFIGMSKHRRLFFGNLKEMYSFEKGFLKGYIRASLPVFFNESLWGIGVTIYGAVIARMGSGPAAAYSIVGTVENMLFATVFGTATAAGVITGKEVGARRRDEALNKSRFFHLASLAQGIVIGVVLILIAPKITRLFEMTPETRSMCVDMLRICGCFMIPKSYSLLAIVGTMRSAGDTVFCMVCDVGGVWFIGVPLVMLTGIALHFPASLVLTASYVEEVVKCIAVRIRLKNDNWIHDLVN